jgi:choline kinase
LKGIILSAGQGRRLLPLTKNLPKCLLRIEGRSVLEWQLRMLAGAGVRDAVVVVGFGAVEVERELADAAPAEMRVRTVFNERYDVADNLVSCAAARSEMQEDFLLLNGDTLADSKVVPRLLASPDAPVAIVVARKDEYDADDMKVSRAGQRVVRVGKDLAAAETHGEAIGFSLYRGRGPELFTRALDEILREPEGALRWYLSAVNLLATRGFVHSVEVEGARWAEIDYLHDLPRARAVVAITKRQPGTTPTRPWVVPEGGSGVEESPRAISTAGNR